MGSRLSKKMPESSSSILDLSTTVMQYTELSSYEAACELDAEQVINTLAINCVEVRSLSFDYQKQTTVCLLETNQLVVRAILDCKDEDIWNSQELSDLVDEYFDNSSQTLDLCDALDNCLKRARDSQMLIGVAIQQFEDDRYARTLEELKNFKEADDAFSEEFFQNFRSVYRNQMALLEKLKLRRKKIDKKLKYIRKWRKAFTAALICWSIRIGSLWKNYEDILKSQKEGIGLMQAGTFVAIKDFDDIRVLIDRLEIEIEALTRNVEFAIEEAVDVAMEEMKKKMGMFMENVEDLRVQIDICRSDIIEARNVVLQRIMEQHRNRRGKTVFCLFCT